MTCRGISKKFHKQLGQLTEKNKETFLELFCLEEYRVLGLDFFNCVLISKNILPIPDKCIKYLVKFDIIKSYSPRSKIPSKRRKNVC